MDNVRSVHLSDLPANHIHRCICPHNSNSDTLTMLYCGTYLDRCGIRVRDPHLLPPLQTSSGFKFGPEQALKYSTPTLLHIIELKKKFR